MASRLASSQLTPVAGCDTCTDDLLDEVEPLTYYVRDAVVKLNNVSVGIHAANRLQRLQKNVSELLVYDQRALRVISAIELFFKQRP